LEIQIGSAKAPKYGLRESGDTIEIIERPHGGISAVLVDGQRSGQAAKRISNIVARKAISLLGEGVRDGAAARASHDYLRTHRSGQVSAELQIVSVDLQSGTLVVSRNSRCAAVLVQRGTLCRFDDPSEPVGIHPSTKPVIRELPLTLDSYVVLHTDGLEMGRSETIGQSLTDEIALAQARSGASAQSLADALLNEALEAAQHRPKDDVSVLVMAVGPGEIPDGIRRLTVSLPVDPVIAAKSISR
jgi:serine phosphatase RsbU (regulator of sigma subunit)